VRERTHDRWYSSSYSPSPTYNALLGTRIATRAGHRSGSAVRGIGRILGLELSRDLLWPCALVSSCSGYRRSRKVRVDFALRAVIGRPRLSVTSVMITCQRARRGSRNRRAVHTKHRTRSPSPRHPFVVFEHRVDARRALDPEDVPAASSGAHHRRRARAPPAVGESLAVPRIDLGRVSRELGGNRKRPRVLQGAVLFRCRCPLRVVLLASWCPSRLCERIVWHAGVGFVARRRISVCAHDVQPCAFRHPGFAGGRPPQT
jgi:hypothetical protein